jgi:hypothetical protein
VCISSSLIGRTSARIAECMGFDAHEESFTYYTDSYDSYRLILSLFKLLFNHLDPLPSDDSFSQNEI